MKAEALTKLGDARDAILRTYAAMPDEALAWLKPGDDYAIGGIIIHLVQSLEGYVGTLTALRHAGYRDTDGPGENERVVDAQLVHARRGLTPTEREATLGEMSALHDRLTALARDASETQFAALAGLTYPGDEVPYPTSVALVVQWMTEHYAEHVPHAEQLFAAWKKSQ